MAATSFLTMTEAKLPPGFRFHPRDEELINEYLAKKLSGEFHSCPMMEDVDLNKVEPWELPGTLNFILFVPISVSRDLEFLEFLEFGEGQQSVPFFV